MPNTIGRRLAGEGEGVFVDTLRGGGMAPLVSKMKCSDNVPEIKIATDRPYPTRGGKARSRAVGLV